MTSPSDGSFPDLATDVPSPARMYDYLLGGKDNFAVDRETVQAMAAKFPGSLDAPRNNRLFLYRAVRFLARDAGIRQFLDLGSGLPTQNNVHHVTQQFQPGTRVVYVDNDPIVLSHGRALLARDDSTIVVSADMTEPAEILADEQVQEMLRFDQPIAVLMLSVAHWIFDDDTVRRVLANLRERTVPGSYLAFTHMCGVDQQAADEANEEAAKLGMIAKNRTPADVDAFLAGLEPVEPGLRNITDWRPDPDQSPLNPVDEPLQQYVGASAQDQRMMEYGGVLRQP